MHIDLLMSAGLTKEEAEVYEILLSKGELRATEIWKESSQKRSSIYNVARELVKRGLVEEYEKNNVIYYRPTHPNALLIDFQSKQESARQLEETIRSAIPSLVSEYNKIHNKPSVTYAEGIRGFEKLHHDILETGEDILLFRSPKDDKFPETAEIIEKSLKEYKKRGIKTRALTPLVESTLITVEQKDAERGVERRIIPRDKFDIPAQIIIYGGKVAITDFGNTLLTTTIDNPAIETTFRILFEYIWQSSTLEHEAILKAESDQNNPLIDQQPEQIHPDLKTLD